MLNRCPRRNMPVVTSHGGLLAVKSLSAEHTIFEFDPAKGNGAYMSM
eukprot:SAG22_NODE_17809_length_298_cov_0.753769_1_plen_47_part_00